MRNIVDYNLMLNISGLLLIIAIIGFILFLTLKKNKTFEKFIIGIIIIALSINLYVGFGKYQIERAERILSEYYELKTCEEMENRFATDLKKGEIKYFQFGISTDIELQKTLKTKYGIECFGMGCFVESEMDCYNDLVNNYLKEKYKDTIIDN